MLYEKSNTVKLEQELFENPTSEYRGTPFWAWNTTLEKEELKEQIEVFKEMGFGGFHMHVRQGHEVPYLSPEFMDAVGCCVEKAKEEKMLAWLYDEDRWPSGCAGGFVTKEKKHRQKYLLMTKQELGAASVAEVVGISAERDAKGVDADARISGTDGDIWENATEYFLAAFDVTINESGEMVSCRPVARDEKTANKWYFYICIKPGGEPRFNYQAYVDTLSKEAMDKFIGITYEAFKSAVGDEFGKAVPAIFTDEPQFINPIALANGKSGSDAVLPWTWDFARTYQKEYGADICESLPELFFAMPGDGAKATRYRYYRHITERFASAYMDNIGKWCGQNNIMFTGHVMGEDTLDEASARVGDPMRMYKEMQLPGIDMLFDDRAFTTAKQCQSVVHQYGKEGMLSELYGVTGWDFDFRGHKFQGDWQACLGVTVRVPHLAWQTMKGEGKRDYPASIFYQSPWYKEYKLIEDHFSRVHTAMTRGKACVRTAVLHPIESYWMLRCSKAESKLLRMEMELRFKELADWLLTGSMDFDYLAESLLEDQCGADVEACVRIVDVCGQAAGASVRSEGARGQAAGASVHSEGARGQAAGASVHSEGARGQAAGVSVRSEGARGQATGASVHSVDVRGQAAELCAQSLHKGGSEPQCLLCVGQMAYDTIIVADCQTLRPYTIKLLKTFREKGGRLIFVGNTPYLSQGEVSAEARILAQMGECIPYSKAKLYEMLKDNHEIMIRNIDGGMTDNLLYQLREDNDCKWLFIANARKAVLPHISNKQDICVTVQGTYEPYIYNTMTGEIRKVSYSNEHGLTCIYYTLYQSDSLLLKLENRQQASGLMLEEEEAFATELPVSGECGYSLEEPNVLVLDMAQYSVDGGPLQETEEIMRIDAKVRAQLGLTSRRTKVVQPWAIKGVLEDHTLKLTFRIQSRIDYKEPMLAMENLEKATLVWNGEKVESSCCGYYVDKYIHTTKLPSLRAGENILEITMPFGLRTDLENCYLLGDFGTAYAGRQAYICEKPGTIFFGSIVHQGMAFYGGNVQYHSQLVLDKKSDVEIELSLYRGALVKVLVDGKEQGNIIFAPYKLKISNLEAGVHQVTYILYGNRYNTFSALHTLVADKDRVYIGPDYWRSEGDQWAYEYQTRPMGILKTPVVRVVEKS